MDHEFTVNFLIRFLVFDGSMALMVAAMSEKRFSEVMRCSSQKQHIMNVLCAHSDRSILDYSISLFFLFHNDIPSSYCQT